MQAKMITCVSICLALFSYAAAQTPLTINWDAVSTTQNPSITNLNQDLGTCLCDLTRNACDTNCCCDSDCSANEIDSFFKGGCLAPNNGNSSAIPYCSKQLLLINARSDAASIIVTKDTNAALCVVTSNSPIKGTFYVDPSTFTTQSSFLARYSLSEFPVEDEAYNVENGFSKSVASYRAGDSIKIAYPAAGLEGILRLPSRGPSGLCNEGSPAKFAVDEQESCAREVKNIATLCATGTVLDAAYYTTGFNVLKNPADSNSITTTTVSKSQCYDSASGATTTCAAGFPTWNANTTICSNAVIGVVYNVRYATEESGVTTIDVITAEITYGTLALAVNTLIEQSFQVSYVSTAHPDPVPKSGSPGYVNGKAILAGTLTSKDGKSAVSVTSNPSMYGLTLPGEVVLPGGVRPTCSSSTDRSHRSPVLFGQTTMSSCTKYFTLADLKGNCAAIRKDIYVTQTLTAAGIDLIGKFGNASLLNVQDWVSVINDVPESLKGDKAIADSVTGMCSSLLTEFGIEFLVANFGSIDNPQQGIVGARYNYVAGSFQYRCLQPLDCVTPSALDPALGAAVPGSTAQPFRLKSTVSFVPVQVDRATLVPPPPRLIPPLPNDIFYPFQL